jgi:hypothetical protein
MRHLMMALPLSLLTACGASISDRAPVPPSLTAPCRPPAVLPERALTQTEVEVLWGRDRTALRDCGSKVDGLRVHLSERP